MKKNLILAAAMLLSAAAAHADEGMWTLYNLPHAVYEQMKTYGFSAPYEKLYKGEDAIMKSVVNFSGYCSGVVVSPDGLVLTNHHCGFEAIRSHSTVEHDYMLNGFYAKSFAEELPNKSMFVSFMVEQKDITPELEKRGIKNMTNDERAKLLNEVENEMIKEVHAKDKTLDLEIKPFYEGNKYYATTYRTFRDLRLVFAIPKSMGKFGGETDNWMWPRQTCDYSVFRIYADPKTNGPAEYSKDNVPYHPQHWTKVSMDGYKEGDFAMTMGYPGSTERYLSSYGIEQMHMRNATRSQARGVKQDVMVRHMRADEAVRIKYDSKFATSSNYWKNSIGMNKCIDSIGLIQQKRDYEFRIKAYVDSTGYLKGQLNFDTLKALYAQNSTASHDLLLLSESFSRTNELTTRAMMGAQGPNVVRNEKKPSKSYLLYDDDQKTWDEGLDKEVLAVSLKNYKEHIADVRNLPAFYTTIANKYGNDYRRFVDDIWSKTVLMKNNKRIYFNNKAFDKDPGVRLGKDLKEVAERLKKALGANTERIEDQERMLCAAKLRMEEDMPHYSDANFTMRLSYGRVGGYNIGGQPSGYYTASESIVEKMKAGDKGVIDYQAEPIMHELMSASNYGPYADKTTGKMQLCLLTNNDITGGNSGSPLFDGQGRLIGLAFDGNWDSLASDIMFDKVLARTISVDIRFVLYLMDRWGHADRLLQEIGAK